MGHAAHRRQPAGSTSPGCTTTSRTASSPARSSWRKSRPRRARDEVQLHDAARLPARRLARAHQDGRRARATTRATRPTRPGTRTSGCSTRPPRTRRRTSASGRTCRSVYLREPTLICQALATLDELTGGRAEGVISCGNFGMLAQYGIDWKTIKPLSRVKEAHEVMRTFLDDGRDHVRRRVLPVRGLFTFARPVQERLPLYIGAMRGPKSIQLAGEVSDGVHSALGYYKEAYDYVVENVKIGAERAGRELEGPRHRRLVRDHLRRRTRKRRSRPRACHRHLLHLLRAATSSSSAHGIDPAEMKADRRGARQPATSTKAYRA